MALFSTTNLKDFDAIGGIKRNIKLGDKIYSGEEQALTVKNILNNNRLYATHRTIDVSGKNVHEFTIKIKPEVVIPVVNIERLLNPHYEIELAC
ncbi:hypothetical protein [Mucilaginibacter glaciei]|uniref:Uncharacterized protein n=1 Tax=Mucilaginibacter glaciei TaxID=2772109 RepID=A0A926S2G6_9SPHI|nr:hypothetical protein [Mucilaginibacter glaciei]MBD1394118.1 hypothetical protein [Mucilaginibacter glaciei]